jgi:putative ABC transport system ATP-binding protein
VGGIARAAARGIVGEIEPGPEDVILVDDVHKTYHLGEVSVQALRGVSLTVKRGDFLIITGRNGSGKSTLMHQLGLLDNPSSGRIFIAGQEVTAMREKDRARLRLEDLGYIFQEFALISELTALENVMLPTMMVKPTSECRVQAREVLSLVGLDEQATHLPNQLSGGEQQKVAIARSLMNEPTVLFADEPTANLDLVSAQDVLSVFDRLNKEEKHTIVMVTHEHEETIYGNRIITLSDGKIIYEE